MKQSFYSIGLSFLLVFIFVGCSVATDDRWPKDLPEFNYGSVVRVLYDQDTGMFNGAVYSNVQNPRKVFENYQAALLEKGWVLDTVSTDRSLNAVYDLDDKMVNIMIFKSGEVAQLMYID